MIKHCYGFATTSMLSFGIRNLKCLSSRNGTSFSSNLTIQYNPFLHLKRNLLHIFLAAFSSDCSTTVPIKPLCFSCLCCSYLCFSWLCFSYLCLAVWLILMFQLQQRARADLLSMTNYNTNSKTHKSWPELYFVIISAPKIRFWVFFDAEIIKCYHIMNLAQASPAGHSLEIEAVRLAACFRHWLG